MGVSPEDTPGLFDPNLGFHDRRLFLFISTPTLSLEVAMVETSCILYVHIILMPLNSNYETSQRVKFHSQNCILSLQSPTAVLFTVR